MGYQDPSHQQLAVGPTGSTRMSVYILVGSVNLSYWGKLLLPAWIHQFACCHQLRLSPPLACPDLLQGAVTVSITALTALVLNPQMVWHAVAARIASCRHCTVHLPTFVPPNLSCWGRFKALCGAEASVLWSYGCHSPNVLGVCGQGLALAYDMCKVMEWPCNRCTRGPEA